MLSPDSFNFSRVRHFFKSQQRPGEVYSKEKAEQNGGHSTIQSELTEPTHPESVLGNDSQSQEAKPMITGQMNGKGGTLDADRADFANAVEAMKRGNIHLERGNFEAAIANYRQATQLDPESAEAYQQLAEALSRQGNLEEAAVCYRLAIEFTMAEVETDETVETIEIAPAPATPTSLAPQATSEAVVVEEEEEEEELPWFEEAAFYMQQGEALCNKERWQDAIGVCKQAFSILGAETAAVCILLGRAFQGLHQFQDAEQAYTKALAVQPDSAENHARMGSLLADQERWNEAIAAYQEALRLDPKFSGAYWKLAQVFQQIGQTDKSTEYWYRALQLEPGWANAEEHLKLGHTLAKQGKLEQATKCYHQVIQLEPDRAEAYYALGEVKASQKKWSEAIAYYTQAIEWAPQNVEVHYNLGKALVAQSRWQEAVACFDKTIRLQPDGVLGYLELRHALIKLDRWQPATQNIKIQSGIARSLAAQNRWEEALTYYQRILKLEPTVENYISVRDLLTHLEHWEEALPYCRKVAQLQPDSNQAFHHLGDVFSHLEQWDKAVRAFKRAIQLDPEFAWSYNNLGDVLIKLEQWDEAAVVLQKAIAINPEFCWSHYNLGDVFVELERLDEAIGAYRQALVLEPELENAQQKLYQTLHQRAKTDLAAVMDYYLKAIEQDPHNPENFHSAIAIQPNNPELYMGLAIALVHHQEMTKADMFYKLALQLNPDLTKKAPQLQDFLAQRDVEPVRRALTPEAISVLRNRKMNIQLIESSGLFDHKYYLRQRPSIRFQENDLASLIEHYLDQGCKQGINPHPLFHTVYYLKQNPELDSYQINPFAHYLYCGANEQRDPNPWFDTASYLEKYPDVAEAKLNALLHYLEYGTVEGRVAFSMRRTVPLLSKPVVNSQAEYLRCFNSDKTAIAPYTSSLKVGVYCSSLGNYFMAEIADFIAAALEQAGTVVVRLSELDSRPHDLDHDIIVAPHEFFYLGTGDRYFSKTLIDQSIMVNVEQPHTSWFSKAFRYLRQASLVLDINVQSASLLEQLGIPAYFFPLGYLPHYQDLEASAILPDAPPLRSLSSPIKSVLPGLDEDLSHRPIDLHFIGTLSERREHFFATSAAWLSRFRSFLHIPPVEGPLLAGQEQTLDTQAAIGLSRRSKILLNIHRESTSYWEWHRIVFHGLWQKTLVVTETSHQIPGLRSGEHYIECQLEEMEDMINWLLTTPAGRQEAERIRVAGHEALKQVFDMSTITQNVIGLMIAAAGRKV
jgi:tetratricopeptide (TPR) repeat protein